MGKRGILIFGILGLILGSGWLAWWTQQAPQPAEPICITLKDEAAQLDFLQAQSGITYRCIAAEEVRIPVCIDSSYQAYAALQEAQQLPLSAHLGETVTRYTYAQSSSGQDSLCAELLIDADYRLIGAVQYTYTNSELQQLLPCS